MLVFALLHKALGKISVAGDGGEQELIDAAGVTEEVALYKSCLEEVRYIYAELHQVHVAAGDVAGNIVAGIVWQSVDGDVVLLLHLCGGKKIEGGLQSFVADGERQGDVKALGDLYAGALYLIETLLGGGDMSVLDKGGDGIVHLEVICKGFLLHNCDDVILGKGSFYGVEHVANKDTDVVFGSESAGLDPCSKGVVLTEGLFCSLVLSLS